MPITPDQPFPKAPGNAIRSKDWNDLVTETQRLDNAKVNKAGDTMSGPLTINAALIVNSKAPPGETHPVCFDTGDRIRLRQGASASAGLWLFQNMQNTPSEDRAFIGMGNDDVVGFWGDKGAGWALTMHVKT